MRVLVVCRYKPHLTGHAAPFIIEQYKALQSVGTLESKALDAAHSDAERLEVELFPLKENYLKQWKALRKKIRERKPDVIHAHYGLTCLVANMVTREVPVVSTYHGSDINHPKVRMLSKIAIGLSAWNIFVSKRNMSLAGATDGEKCSIVSCGISLSEEQLQSRTEARNALGWKADEKKVLFAGAFDNAVKDPELAKAAVALLEGVEIIELKGYSREEVNRLMCAANCLLMTSKTEGSPQVTKEAMACGCPIVSVDVGDVAERTEGVSGCFVVKSREPRDIAEALKKALTFNGRTNGREKILEAGLTNEQVAKRIIAIYEDIINK